IGDRRTGDRGHYPAACQTNGNHHLSPTGAVGQICDLPSGAVGQICDLPSGAVGQICDLPLGTVGQICDLPLNDGRS
ncbi:MAG: hypothetical protein ACRESK_03250, partial [Gammaproteobacteria bacterium]